MGGTVRWPPMVKEDPNIKDRSQYCTYHNDHDHKIKDFISFGLEVLELLRKGYLNEFLSDKSKRTWGQGVMDREVKHDSWSNPRLWIEL